MFVACHITLGQLSNFVGANLEVKRTIRNIKLLFTWGCSILLLKKQKEGPENGFLFFFFNNSDIFLKYFNSNHNLPSYSLFSKCFSWLFYLSVHRGTGLNSWLFLFFTPPLARDSLSRSPRACLCLTEKHWKISPVLPIQASSMKLRVHGFFFLVFLHIKTDGKNKPFLKTT